MTRDSISARPTIIGMKILFCAEGLRAIPSRPAAMARPCPIAPPNAAIAMPKPAARAMTAFTFESPPAAGAPSAAIATDATATKSRATRKEKMTLWNIGFPPFGLLSRRPVPPVRRRCCRAGAEPLVLLPVRHGARDVDHGEDGEHERLHERDEEPQAHEDRRHDDRDQRHETRHHRVVPRDVPEETQGEGHRPRQVGDDLDRKHD